MRLLTVPSGGGGRCHPVGVGEVAAVAGLPLLLIVHPLATTLLSGDAPSCEPTPHESQIP